MLPFFKYTSIYLLLARNRLFYLDYIGKEKTVISSCLSFLNNEIACHLNKNHEREMTITVLPTTFNLQKSVPIPIYRTGNHDFRSGHRAPPAQPEIKTDGGDNFFPLNYWH